MKGAFFQKPFEWQIELIGETWEQGSELKGSISVKNCTSESVPLIGKVILGEAEIKKIQSRDPKAYKSEDCFDLPSSIELKSNEVQSWPLNFKIPENCSVTDKKISFYVGYGPTGKDSNLQINIVPKKIFGEIIK
ncbi:MAG: hypothetical protein K2P81_05725, partial [Bacteriovoracaceae bacterium]|nr:hypothetical protein [Bacteriovoracaceae bacterium]